MQNVDYSKKLRSDSRKAPNLDIQKSASVSQSQGYSIINFIGSKNSSWSFLYLLVGAILIFTSGLFIGMRIDHRENLFSSNNEQNSFKNLGTNHETTTAPALDNTSENTGKNSNIVEDDKKQDPNQNTAQNFNKSTIPSIPKGLKYPPLPNKVNYIIQIGNFTHAEANKWGKYLIKQREDFQGRLFRTSTGKLYLGYYYSYKDAKVVLKQIQGLNGGMFEEASIKNIQF